MAGAKRSDAGARRAVVTGGAGFIGSHVVDALLARDYEVLVVDDLSTGSEHNVPSAAQLARLDIVDAPALASALSSFAPSLVCHLAAQASVTVSVESPERDLAVNVQGTFNVLQAARAVGAKVVFASTGGALYGEGAPLPSPETTPAEPLSPYGASKLAGEAYVTTWGRLHEIPNVVLRLGNVYGPRQNSKGEAGVVAIFSDLLRRGSAPTVFGDGQQTRDYIYVGDVAEAFVLAAEADEALTLNVGRGSESSVLDLLDVLQALAPAAIEPTFEPLRAGELTRSALDSTLLRTRLGWQPQVDLREGLTATYRFYAEAVDAADLA
ncbi:MAG TPA: NAD-dependent epimerase/dehydratase family protein [Solirubrobacteraceae bacterium]|nr:NAD-dependent epimerase/dehydratase family protein [Solirubrobacteraceae bacterium]